MSSKLQVHIRDSNIFSPRNVDRPNPHFQWVYDRSLQINDITVFTDAHITEANGNKSRVKVAWLLEPPSVAENAYQYIKVHHHNFDCVFTFIDGMLEISDKFVMIPYGTSWIHKGYRKIYPKTKQTSIVASAKRQTKGHRFRHQIVERFGTCLDVMGRGYRPIKNKLEAHRDYRYSVVVENGQYNSYFSEKLMDCFMTGSIPIYWGFSKVTEIFNPGGVLVFNTMDELGKILCQIGEADYLSREAAIKDNFDRAQRYLGFEAHMYEGYFKQFDC